MRPGFIYLFFAISSACSGQIVSPPTPQFETFPVVNPGRSYEPAPTYNQPNNYSTGYPNNSPHITYPTAPGPQQKEKNLQQMGFIPSSPQVPGSNNYGLNRQQQINELKQILLEDENSYPTDTVAFEKERLRYNAGIIDEDKTLAKDSLFEKAFRQISQMLRENNYDFKKAVFATEKAHDHTLDYESYNNELNKIARKCRTVARKESHFKEDSIITLSWAIMKYMVDSMIYYNAQGQPYKKVNYTYDFDDVFGEKDIKKMFVTKLLKKHNGNCHSLPYLYKCIAQTLNIGPTAHLAYLPNHVYIRQHFDGRWWNCELTSAEFIDDYQLMASGYVFVPGVNSGIYMTPLDEKQSIACLVDLATYYEWKYGYDSFVLKCIQRTLEYYPNCIQALMMRANYWNLAARHYFKRAGITDISQAGKDEDADFCAKQYESIVKQMDGLGFSPVPKDVYEKWLNDMQLEKIKREKQKQQKK